jgi:hypothetical protein
MIESPSSRARRLRRKTQKIRDAIHAMDFVCLGSMNVRTKVCGKSNCRCAQDPEARHGPYYEWARYADGRLGHHIVTAEQAEAITHAIANYRELENLLAKWIAASIEEISAIREGR